MKRFDKLVLIWLISIVMMLMIFGCQPIEPEFSVLGKWEGTPWYCDQCPGSDYRDINATIKFEILAIDKEGVLTITDGDRYVPSCSGNCTAHPWSVVSASFVNNSLQIEWHTGHVFTGELAGNEFTGIVDYTPPPIYLWNKSITLSRR